MDFQKELSMNAKNPQEIERQAKQQAEQRMQEQARSLAKEICQQIKPQLLEKVKSGKYTQEYNKGTVDCYIEIPHNRYLEIHNQYEYKRNTYIRTREWRSFLVKQETQSEYNCLRNELSAWGQAEQIEISWVVLMRNNSYYEKSFPCSTPQEFPPNTYPVFQLAIKAVSHFPVDPSLPMDHMTEEDTLDWHKRLDERVAFFEQNCYTRKKELIVFCINTLLSTVVLILFSWLKVAFWILCSLAAIFFFGVLAYNAYGEYQQAKEKLESARKKAEQEKVSTAHQ